MANLNQANLKQANLKQANLYQAIGGTAGCEKLAAAFYARVKGDPVLRPMFPGTSLRCAIEAFTAFLVQFLGGPAEDMQKRWWLSLAESHRRFAITEEHRKAWMGQMTGALADAGIGHPLREELRQFFEDASPFMVNEGPSPALGQYCPLIGEVAKRWDMQRDVERFVAVVGRGWDELALDLMDGPLLRAYGPSTTVGLLAYCIRSGKAKLLAAVGERIAGEPQLAHERYAGRTLLYEAAAQGNAELVELLLGVGADPNARDGGRHTPLYGLANECAAPGGAAAVRALIRGGARVDAADGVKRVTALHAAARRGNVEVADALLACGAELEARDSLGETPLRRAVNCNQVAVASLLVARGADVRSRGSKRLTPLEAARSEAMRQALSLHGAR